MEITYDYYRIFYYAAKYKSFSKAAEILMSNQPNITHFMNNLENQLGCRLFIRSNRGVTLTREGEKLYKHVTIAYQHFQLAELELANDKSLQSGIITVGVSEIALHLLILQVMADFRKAYPGIRIRLSNHSTPETIQEVKDGLVDLAVVSTPADIPATFFSNFYQRYGLKLNPDIEAGTIHQILPMVVYDLGVGFLPENVGIEALEDGKIIKVPLIEKIPQRQICLVESKRTPLSIAANALKQFINNYIETKLKDKA